MIIAISNGLKQIETLAAVAAAAMVKSGNRHREKQQNAQQQGRKDSTAPYKKEERVP